ncbi:unnamed protein product [Didymodactylos carnosus]|uniref:Uncharacterized protein n=1 Tax=Didymodactylos carnosus TaxID=1234261 RepID=A0A8S2DKK6_9BILA|nr:unnamed protein product [Didymodactylos carnosus]CAF3724056.1 unnamed protein product [Didymodactylos carnosus]
MHDKRTDLSIWYTSAYLANGAVYHNPTNNNTIGNKGQTDEILYYPDQLTIYSGTLGNRACIRFIVPDEGRYNIRGDFFSPRSPSSTNGYVSTDVHLSVNSVELQSLRVSLCRNNSGSFIYPNLHLNSVDVVQFEVDSNLFNRYYDDTTGANITISRLA